MVASRKFLLLASLLFASPALADDVGPACNPNKVHDEANNLKGAWRLIVIPQTASADSQTTKPAETPKGECNQLIVRFGNGPTLGTLPVKIKSYSFTGNHCNDGVLGEAGLKGKVTATYCYVAPSGNTLRRVHQFLLYNDDPNRPYIASYSLWDSTEKGGPPMLKGIGNEAAGGGVNAWLVSENPQTTAK